MKRIKTYKSITDDFERRRIMAKAIMVQERCQIQAKPLLQRDFAEYLNRMDIK